MAANANTGTSAAACWIYAEAVIKVYTSVAAVAVQVNYTYCVLDLRKPERPAKVNGSSLHQPLQPIQSQTDMTEGTTDGLIGPLTHPALPNQLSVVEMIFINIVQFSCGVE